MITIIVSIATSAIVTAGLYWLLHRANPTVAQQAIDAVKTEAVNEVKAAETKAQSAVVDEVKKTI